METQNLFQHLYDENKALTETEIAELSTCHIIFIPSIFSKFIHLFVGKYFKPQTRFLKKHNLKNYSVLWSTELSCESMGKKIKSIADKHEKIMVITHSKGGIDFLTFMVDHPQYSHKLKGWLCLQAPIWGSKFADLLYSFLPMRYVFYFFVLLYGGEKKSVIQLTTKYRTDFIAKNKFEIEKILKRKDIIFIASSNKNKNSAYGIPLLLGNIYYHTNNTPADGLVALEDAAIGQVHIELSDVDHASTVLPSKQKNFSNLKASSAFFRILALNSKAGV